MDENLHTTEDLFYSNLEGHAEPPPPSAWDHISQTLDRDNLTLIKKKYDRVKRFAALLLLLLAGFSVYEINSSRGNKRDGNNKIAQAQTAPGEKNNDYVADGGNQHAGNISPLYKEAGSRGISPGLKEKKLPGNISAAAAYAFSKDRLKRSPAGIRMAINDPGAEIYLFSAVENNDVDHTKTGKGSASVNNPVPVEKQSGTMPAATLTELLRSAKTDSTQNNIAHNILKKKNKKAHPFSFTPFFSPDIAWYRLQDDKPDNIDDANEVEKAEQHEFSSTFGVSAEYALNDRWSLQSGLSFSNTNITLEPKVLYAAPDIDGTIKYRINTSSGDAFLQPSFNAHPATGDSLYSYSSLHSLQYIGIPLALVRRFSAGRFTIKTMAGISANILVHAKVETMVEKDAKHYAETIDQIRGLKKMYFGGLAGVGLEYGVGKRTSLSFTPSLRFAINSINKENAVRSYPISFGFSTGLKISF